MTNDPLVDRLKELQDRLIEMYNVTIHIRNELELRAHHRRLAEQHERRVFSRGPDSLPGPSLS